MLRKRINYIVLMMTSVIYKLQKIILNNLNRPTIALSMTGTVIRKNFSNIHNNSKNYQQLTNNRQVLNSASKISSITIMLTYH